MSVRVANEVCIRVKSRTFLTPGIISQIGKERYGKRDRQRARKREKGGEGMEGLGRAWPVKTYQSLPYLKQPWHIISSYKGSATAEVMSCQFAKCSLFLIACSPAGETGHPKPIKSPPPPPPSCHFRPPFFPSKNKPGGSCMNK